MHACMWQRHSTDWHTLCTARRLWDISWPLSGMEVLTFAKELIITAFVGHLGAFELSSLVLSQTLYNVRASQFQ